MRKSTKMLKRFAALFLVVLMSIENFAAVVGDNDGSAFITKAELDNMQSNFQSQLDRYNTSLDSKIDGAIASYLAGVTIAKKEPVKTLIKSDYKYLESFGKDNWLPLRRGGIKGTITIGMIAIGINTETHKGVDGTKQGATMTVYTSKDNDLNLKSLRGSLIDNRFYNLNIALGNIDVSSSKITRSGSRLLTDSYNMDKLYIGINHQRYWPDCPLADTFHNNYATARSKGAHHYIGYHITDKDWINDDEARHNPELMIYYDSASDERKILKGYTSDDTTPSGVANYNSWGNFVSWRAYYQYPGNDKNNAWTNDSNAVGSTWSTDAKWELARDPKLTLAVLANYEYKIPSVVWPMDLSGGYIIQTCTDRSTKDDLGFDLVSYYQWFYEDESNPGLWIRDTIHTQSEAWSDTFVATDTSGYTGRARPNYYHVNPYDWTWKSYIITGIDQRPLFKWNKDILTDEPSTTLKNYLENYNASRGIPIYEASNDGEFEFEPTFSDTTKQYNIWVCKGPANTDFDTASPTNTYTLKNMTQNSNKSYTISSGNKLKLDVYKGDVVYILWCEKDKKGGGVIKNPITAYFTEG